MKLSANIKIGTRLAAGFGATLVAVCLVGILGLVQASRIYDGSRALADNWLPSVEALGNVRASANDLRRTTLRYLLETDTSARVQLKAAHDKSAADFDKQLAEYGKLVSSPEEQKMFDAIKAAWLLYQPEDAKVIALSDQGEAGFAEARALATGVSTKAFSAVTDLIAQDVDLNHNGAQQEVAAGAERFHSATVMTIGLVVLAVVAAAAAAIMIARSIVEPVKDAVRVVQTVASGDLTARIDAAGRDEMSQLLFALKDMTERLGDIVGRVRHGSDSIATASAQIAAGNTDLSQRTEEQAASLEETAASMEQLTATVKQNADNATQGNGLAANASQTAMRGGDVVGRVVETMREIAQSSEQVSQIISVIEGIAFQTNILALNAAVEAARAGEQGRGFAVVAGEVRTLAQRSANAAKEIKGLITASVERVSAGTALVDEAGRTMDEVVQATKRVSDLMGEISAASDEQRRGIEQVNVAVTQMDQVTQQNAALVEEASAAADAMADQSQTLREVVSFFRAHAATERARLPA